MECLKTNILSEIIQSKIQFNFKVFITLLSDHFIFSNRFIPAPIFLANGVLEYNEKFESPKPPEF